MKILALTLLICALSTSVEARCRLFDVACREDAYCRSLGAIPGTDNYIQCRLYRDQARQKAWSDAAEYFQRQQQLQQQRQFYNCTTNYFGNTARTTCY